MGIQQILMTCGAGGGTPGFTGILDTLGLSVSQAYSLRRLTSAYSGSLIRVRRSSDNAEQDIGFDSNGDLDIASMTSFVGANSGFIVTFYDQSGNTSDLVTSSTARQPRIVNAGTMEELIAGGGMPGFFTDGTDDLLEGSASAPVQPTTRSTVLRFKTVTTVNASFTSDNAQSAMYIVSSNNLATYWGTSLTFKTGLAVDDAATVTEIGNGNSSSGTFNGTKTTGPGGTLQSLRRSLGGAWDGTNRASFASAIFSEHIYFLSALSDTDRGTLEADQKAYWGTP